MKNRKLKKISINKNSKKTSKFFISQKKEIETNPIYSEKFRQLYFTIKRRRRIEWLKKYNFNIRILITLILSICLAGTYFFKTEFKNFINFVPSVNYEEGIYVHFIDVGQGKAIAIKTDDGKNFLIDCGHETENQKFFGYLEQYFFVEENISENTFDYFVLTHPDSDHIGNCVELFKNYEIKNCYRPKIFTTEEACIMGIENSKQIDNSCLFESFLEVLKIENCGVMFNFAGEKIEGENYIFEFLTPLEQSYGASNSYSPIILFTFFYESVEFNSSERLSVKFMFTGDATSTGELEVLSILSNSSINNFKVDVLDVSHHGSNSSSTENFLNEIKTEYAVISVGKNNYNMPSPHVIERLIASETKMQKILRTDELGSIIFHVSDNGVLKFFNQKKINLNYSNYTYASIYLNFQLAILLVCFFINLPPKRELI